MPLHHSAAIETLVLDDAPIEVRLAVLPPFGSSKEHNDVDSITKTIPWESGRSSLQAVLTILWIAHTFQINYLRTKKIQKPPLFHLRIREVGLTILHHEACGNSWPKSVPVLHLFSIRKANNDRFSPAPYRPPGALARRPRAAPPAHLRPPARGRKLQGHRGGGGPVAREAQADR